MENEPITGGDVFTQGWEDTVPGGVTDEREAEPLPQDPESPEPQEPERPAAPRERDRDGEIRQFVSEYPGVMPEAIPEEVWRRVRAGESLLSAYDRYEASRLKEENRRLETELQNRRQAEANRQRSAGSQTGAGVGRNLHDPFDDGWELEW